MQDASILKATNPDQWDHIVRVVGGASAITKVYGPGVTVTYVGSGDFDLTWTENPGTLIGMTYGLQATTAADIKGHTVVAGAMSATFVIRVTLFNASDAGHDLAALEWLTLRFTFAQSSALL